MGRDAIDVSMPVEKLAGMAIRIHCLALGGVDLTSSTGRMTMNVINAVAQFERDLLIERTQAGMVRARLYGGEMVSAIAKVMETSRQTIMQVRDGC